ncbi:MAG: AAA family ATPase [Candidatus Diapherotrites archaeon]|uniref:ORC1-type DNA replication protein n=1 Tax=Candidatus Iainarchaeum sp. TaxID=3101447 RepID=A0A8T4L712_9ARCH|nr:AAA family ATPase [Candidatus Diapherotrites archaeon]
MANLFEQLLARETVFRDRNYITPHYTPDKLLFREQQIQKMTEILAGLLNGKRADNLFIYGKVGTGKTASARHVLSHLLDFAGQKNAQVSGTYVNCRNHNSKYRVLSKIVKDFYPEHNFMGYSAAFIYEKLLGFAGEGRGIVLVLDEVDKVKDVDELIYGLSRANDELRKGSLCILGISNNVMFKDDLDPRTKSSLCQQEMVFPAYNAEELKSILSERAKLAFNEGCVDEAAVSLAAAFAAQESGDARKAVMLLMRAGELADKKGLARVSEEEVRRAKRLVEEEIILNMVLTLPQQEQLVLYAIAGLTLERPPLKTLTGETEEGVLYSGEVYDTYVKIAKKFKETVVSSRWYRECISQLEMYGLILTTQSGKGVKGQTRFIKLGYDAKKIKEAIEKGLTA